MPAAKHLVIALTLLLGMSAVRAAENAPPTEDTELPPGAFARSPVRLVLEQEQALSTHEPMYFVAGGARHDSDITGRFQLSFKYRIFAPDSALARWLTPARNFYFAYTQTSLWNLSAESAPFEDTTYRPSLFWQDVGSGRGLIPDAWRLGFEHASNGQGEDDSRSINTAFLRPLWWTEIGSRELLFAPKFYAYLEKSDNPRIYRYRGYADWLVRYGKETSWMAELQLRGTSVNRGSIELNLSYPIRAPFFYRAGGFIYLQYFQGHGESLLDYDVEADPTLRIGLSIVR